MQTEEEVDKPAGAAAICFLATTALLRTPYLRSFNVLPSYRTWFIPHPTCFTVSFSFCFSTLPLRFPCVITNRIMAVTLLHKASQPRRWLASLTRKARRVPIFRYNTRRLTSTPLRSRMMELTVTLPMIQACSKGLHIRTLVFGARNDEGPWTDSAYIQVVSTYMYRQNRWTSLFVLSLISSQKYTIDFPDDLSRGSPPQPKPNV